MAENSFNTRTYQNLPRIVLGFHGCDKSVGERILNSNSEHLSFSTNEYDWLGNGVYFWQNDPQRAYEWAVETHKRRPERVKEPFVIGAVIDLGECLDLCERRSILLLQKSYEDLKEGSSQAGTDINEIKKNSRPDKGGFVLVRPLDCAVIEHAHEIVEKDGIFYDTVCGYFQEGSDAFTGAGIKEKSHIQICVRNTDCIKGYFLPRI